MTRPIQEYREALQRAGQHAWDQKGVTELFGALDELEQLRKEVHEWRTARTHGVCHEELMAEKAMRVDAEDERDAAREHVRVLEMALHDIESNVSSNENKPTSVLANIGRIARVALFPRAPTPATEPAEPEGTT